MVSLKDALYKYAMYIEDKEDKSLPVTSLDYSSLYPSLIMTYNLSPEYLILDKQYADSLRSRYEIHDIEFEYNYEDYLGEKRSRIVKGWTVRHDESLQENNRFGIYPSILRDLFNQRSEMKKILFKYKTIKEELEQKHNPKELDSLDEYKECLFHLNHADSKQKALKVYMNSFYGLLGCKTSPLFIMELAGGITSSGQRNLLFVKKFIEEKGCKVYYGDTDSLYFSLSNRYYTQVHKDYMLNHRDKTRYCTEMIDATFKNIKDLNQQVNNHLLQDNGTRYLKMAYEEVLYPVAFLARKKYYGIPHEGLVNFTPKNLFIRGLEVKKRGVSDILVTVCMEIMWDSMKLKCFKTLRQLVENKIHYVFNHEWKTDDFVSTAMWKPEKHNVPVKKFEQRMRDEGKLEVEPYERFSYVICKITDPSQLYDYRGRKIVISKGDQMEYLEYAKEHNLHIDMKYYFEKQLVGQFARLISYDEEFAVDSYGDYIDVHDKDVDVDDDKTMKKAKKYILTIAAQYTDSMSNYGNAYKNVFRAVQSAWNDKRKQNIPKSYTILYDPDTEASNLGEAIQNKLEYYAKSHNDKWRKSMQAVCKRMSKGNKICLYNVNKHKKSYYVNMLERLNSDKHDVLCMLIDTIRKNNLESMICSAEDTHIEGIVRKYRSTMLDDKFHKSEALEKLSKDDVMDAISANSDVDMNKDAIDSVYTLYVKLLSIEASICQQELIHTIIYDDITRQD